MENILLIGTLSKTSDPNLLSDGVHVMNHCLAKVLGAESNLDIVTYNMSNPEYIESYYSCKIYGYLHPTNRELTASNLVKIDFSRYSVVILSVGFEHGFGEHILTHLDLPDDLKLIIFTHGLNCTPTKEKSWKLLSERPNTHIISLTEYERSYYINNNFISEEKSHLAVSPIVNFDKNVEVKDTTSDKLLLNSRVVKSKGIKNVVDLISQSNLELNIIGKQYTYLKWWSEMKKNFSESISYLGVVPRSELFNLVADSKFLIFLPDVPEGVTLTILEAMSVGTPVITWDDYSYPEIVNPEYNILLPHVDNFIEIFKQEYLPKLESYTSYDKRCELSKSTLESHSIDKFRDSLLGIIREVQNA